MLVSVIIPTHRRPELLKNALQSLCRQSLARESFEVIVVATENDSAYEIIEGQNWPLDLHIMSVMNDPSQGRSASLKRNYGVGVARGNWLGFMDDDCQAHPDWLQTAMKLTEKNTYCAIEGYTHIPEPEKKTLTYKGIKRLGRPGGYQTCNMFYRKKEFQELGGFDPNFPFYLEDTDLAWTLLETKCRIAYAADVIVEHPVPPAEPSRLMDNAVRMRKVPYLYKKHPKTFKDSNMRILPRAYVLFLLFDSLALAALCAGSFEGFGLVLATRVAGTMAYVLRMFYGLSSTADEVQQVFKYSLICPWVSLVQLTRGNLENRTFLWFR